MTLRTLFKIFCLAGSLLCFEATAAEKIRLQLNGYHQFEYAGYYAAVQQGYYREAGLDVEIVEAAPGVDPLIDVLAGKAEFGIGSSNVLLAKAAGKPIVSLAVILQHAPQALFIAGARSADTPLKARLAGKPVMLELGNDAIASLLHQAGIKTNDLRDLDHSFDPMDLVRGKVMAMSGSLLNEPYTFQQQKFAYQTITPRDTGIDLYAGVLYTSARMVAEAGDTVRAFRTASLRGWTYALAHSDEINQHIHAHYSQRRPLEFLQFQAREIQPLIDAEQQPLGSQTAQRWQAVASSLASQGKLQLPVKLDAFIFDPTPPPPAASPINYRLLITIVVVVALLILLFLLVSWRLTRTQFALKTERQRQDALQEQLRNNEERYRGLFNSMDNGFSLNELICDNNGKPVDYRFLELNPAFEQVSGQPRENLIGKRAKEVLPSDANEWLEQFAQVALSGQPKRFEKFSQQTCRWFVTNSYSPAPGKFAAVTQDITERKQAEIALTQANAELQQRYEEISRLQEQLREQAVRDPLTGLHNRRYLDETLSRELSRAQRENYPLCVILIDLDFFKKVNDTYGHLAGDEVLKTFAHLLQDHARKGDVACRYGGEEFMLMLPKMPVGAAVERANLLREKFAATRIPFGGAEIGTTLSIGIALSPLHGQTPEELTHNADLALYVAKSEGRNRAIVYQPEHANAKTEPDHPPATAHHETAIEPAPAIPNQLTNQTATQNAAQTNPGKETLQQEAYAPSPAAPATTSPDPAIQKIAGAESEKPEITLETPQTLELPPMSSPADTLAASTIETAALRLAESPAQPEFTLALEDDEPRLPG